MGDAVTIETANSTATREGLAHMTHTTERTASTHVASRLALVDAAAWPWVVGTCCPPRWCVPGGCLCIWPAGRTRVEDTSPGPAAVSRLLVCVYGTSVQTTKV